jgi:ABC-type Na+ efflux pump permease subunit
MSQTIAEERFTLTLPALVVSPANRVALFLGRAFPSVANGAIVAAFALVVGVFIFGIHLGLSAVPGVVLAIIVVAFSCTGIGLLNAAMGLRWRQTAVLSNFILYFLLLFAGVNVPIDLLPDWLQTLSKGLPITHGAEAAREIVAGSSIVDVAGLLGAEALVGTIYAVAGLVLLRRFEVTARIWRPSGVRLSTSCRAVNTTMANTTIHSRFQVIARPPRSNCPVIQVGISTGRLLAPKIERTACCRISDRPQVASSVSSGRP